MAMGMRKSLATGVPVEESQKTKKARRKLEEKLNTKEKKMTKEALQNKSEEIARWIERHASDRVAVEKEIALFDRNQNSVAPSKEVLKLQGMLGEKLRKK